MAHIDVNLRWPEAGGQTRRDAPLVSKRPRRAVGNVHPVLVHLNLDPQILHRTAVVSPGERAIRVIETWRQGLGQGRDPSDGKNVQVHELAANAANQRRADARNPEHIYGWCALAAFAC